MQALVMIRSFAILLSVLFLVSCQNCICLPSEGLRLGMIGYDSTDIDTIILRKFEKGSNFSQAIDTSQWDRTNVVFSPKNDTFQMAAWFGDICLKSKFDYQVLVPATNQIFSITEMNEPQVQGKCDGKVMCVNTIQSSKLDGSPVMIRYDIIYLKR